MRAGRIAAIGVLALAPAMVAADCVDGVTPDCSDAAAQCGPDLDGASETSTSDGGGDAETGADTGVDGADAADGAEDAADAADEG